MDISIHFEVPYGDIEYWGRVINVKHLSGYNPIQVCMGFDHSHSTSSLGRVWVLSYVILRGIEWTYGGDT